MIARSTRNTRSQNFGHPTAPTACNRCGVEFGQPNSPTSKLLYSGELICVNHLAPSHTCAMGINCRIVH